MEISYTRQPTVTTDKNGYTEDQQTQYITNTAKELVKKERKVQEEELKQDKNWIDSAKILYQMQEDSEGELPNDEALATWALDYVGQVQYNLVSGANAALEFQDADDMQKMAMRYAMETYDMKDITMAGVGRFAKGLATDPTTYIGLGSFGLGFGAKAAASQGAKKAFMQFLSKPTNLAAVEGAIYGAAESGIQQNIEVATGAKDEVSLGEVAMTAGVGAVAGKALGEGVELAGKGVKKYLDYRAEQPTMPMRTGGIPMLKKPQELDKQVVQDYIGSHGERHSEAQGALDQMLMQTEGDYEGPAFRGMTDTEGTLSKLQVGDTYATRGVTSIAKDIETAETFASAKWEGDTAGKKVFVTFDSFENKPVNLGAGNQLGLEDPLDTAKTGAAYLEDEVVIPSGRNFEVTNRVEKDGAIYLNVKEVAPVKNGTITNKKKGK